MRYADLSLTARLILSLSLAGALVFAIVFAVDYRLTRDMVEQQVEAHARDVAMGAIDHIDQRLAGVARDVATLALRLESAPIPPASELENLLRSHVAENDEVFGATVAFEPAFSPVPGRSYAPYFHRGQDGGLLRADLALPSYDYPSRGWYLDPKNRGASVWTEPYFDDGGGNRLMTTFAAPFYRTDARGVRSFAGVVTSDVSVDWLGKEVSSLRLHYDGRAFLFSREGTCLAGPDPAVVMKATLSTLLPAERHDGFVKGRDPSGRDSWTFYAPVPSNGWRLAVIFPAEQMQAGATRASRMLAALFGIGIAVLVFAIVLSARRATRSLAEVIRAIKRIAGGDLDGSLPPAGIGGEVGTLVTSVSRMQLDLKEHIRQLTATTAVKERMEAELTVAHEIQMALLPAELPTTPDIECAGLCLPAREVGGDFYDVRPTAGGRFLFVIGDVSGKGVPAALYMTMAMILARSGARDGCAPEQVVGRINQELAHGNESCMFATLLCGSIDPVDGRVRLANAGHTPALILRVDGSPQLARMDPGVVAGYVEDFSFPVTELELSPGDTLLLYTDGVTEAMTSAGELFGEGRLIEAVKRAHLDAPGFVARIREAVADFVQDAPQADDLTILAIRYLGPNRLRVERGTVMSQKAFAASMESLESMLALVEQAARAARLSAAEVEHVRLAAEEALVNIIRHGYPEKRGGIELSVRTERDGGLVLEITDDGVPFDPLSVPEPARETSLDDRQPGGLGIFLARSVMDTFSYRRVGDRNVLTMSRKPGGNERG